MAVLPTGQTLYLNRYRESSQNCKRQHAPARNRTWTTGSGDLCDILFTTGAEAFEKTELVATTAPSKGQLKNEVAYLGSRDVSSKPEQKTLAGLEPGEN